MGSSLPEKNYLKKARFKTLRANQLFYLPAGFIPGLILTPAI
jgi:hypothetical protein